MCADGGGRLTAKETTLIGVCSMVLIATPGSGLALLINRIIGCTVQPEFWSEQIQDRQIISCWIWMNHSDFGNRLAIQASGKIPETLAGMHLKSQSPRKKYLNRCRILGALCWHVNGLVPLVLTLLASPPSLEFHLRLKTCRLWVCSKNIWDARKVSFPGRRLF